MLSIKESDGGEDTQKEKRGETRSRRRVGKTVGPVQQQAVEERGEQATGDQ